MIYTIGMYLCLIWNTEHTEVIDVKPSNNMFCDSCAEVTKVRKKRNGEIKIDMTIVYDAKYIGATVLMVK